MSPIVKKLPIILFFIYVAFLCVLFHSRDYIMLDFSLNFDHWWYFHHRLQEGSFAQWNPYSLLGRINVQWNHIPVSIFSPFILLTGLTPEIFHLYEIIGTFIAIIAIYLLGRISGYGPYYPLIPIILIFAGGYKVFATFIHYPTYLLFYPLAIAAFLSIANQKGVFVFRQWILFWILLSLSFTGLSFEKIVYGCCFLLLMFFVFGIYQLPNRKNMWRIFGLGIITLAIMLAANAWHLSFLINAMMDNQRVSGGLNITALFNMELLKWVFISILYQPALILVLFNLCLYLFLRHMFGTLFKNISLKSMLFFMAAELILIKSVLLLQGPIENHYGEIEKVFRQMNFSRDIDVIYSWPGIISIVFSVSVYFFSNRKITINKMLLLFIAIFSGFYISEYSWHTWPFNLNRHYFFIPSLFAGLIALGAVNLMMKKKTWIVVVLVVFHFVGESGCFLLFEVLGIPWLVPRAALMEIPFQVVLILEAIILIVTGVSTSIKTAFPGLNFSNIEPRLTFSAKFICLLIAFTTIKSSLMPMKDGVYREEFPFAEAMSFEPFNVTVRIDDKISSWVREAEKNAKLVQAKAKNLNPFKRVYVSDSILRFPYYYKFMPAYSQAINTAPVYASEIPTNMKMIFHNNSKEGETLKAHPEMSPLFFAYKLTQVSVHTVYNLFDYVDQIVILPHKDNNLLFKELMAEEGSDTPRAFATKNIVKLNDYIDERNYLSNMLKQRDRLTKTITTSDKTFFEEHGQSDDMSSLKYELEFIKDQPENIVLRLSCDDNAYLALMDLWSRGWKAYVDGEERKIFRGYISTRFIKVAKGTHVVEFKYTVPGFISASILSLIVWCCMLLAIIVIFKNTRSKKSGNLSS